MQPSLPQPNTTDLARSNELLNLIKKNILDNGPMSFKDFMALALYTPELGYYESPHTFGAEGDFITAAHCGPWFAKMLAKQCEQIAANLPNYNICEFGAGDGSMACDVLQALAEANNLPKQYIIIEKSHFLQNKQRKQLCKYPELLAIVVWKNDLPQNFSGLIFANELLDAMPFQKFKKINDKNFAECFITLENEKLKPIWLTTKNKIPEHIHSLDLEVGHCFEINPSLTTWLEQLYQKCEQAICLLIDYGIEERAYFSRSKGGYARAFYQHHVHDNCLLWPGLQDITTHVNFTEVAQAAYDCGWQIEGYTSQANFLLDCGIGSLDLPAYDTQEGILARAQIKKLLLPQDMGEMFKLLALGKNCEVDLLGMQNEMSHRL